MAAARTALALAALLAALTGRVAAQEDQGWRVVDPDRFAIVSRFAAFSEPPEAMPGVNRLGGQTITVRFRYEGGAFALVVYNESPVKLSQPSMVVATQQALSSSPLFKDGDFAPGEIGTADSPLGPFTYQLVHERRPAGEASLLSCAVYQHLRPAGRAALTGFFCGPSEGFTSDTVNAFFATLGIRGIAMPQ
ncbi:MAG: hypothetical protein IRY94_20025 [Rhodospirillaceae bacterium]|nr:hypothetical protein [Rhodospirillaceae bacterium]